MSGRQKIISYIVLTFTFSFIYQGFIFLTATDTTSERFGNLALLLMYFPGLIALAFAWRDRQGLKSFGLKLKHPLFLLYALIIPLVLIVLFFLAVEIFRIGEQSIISLVEGKVIFMDNNPTSITVFIPLFLFNFTIGSTLAGVLTIGEELGWRGYLQNKLIREFGIIWGIIILGLVWGYWHLPIILMGYNFPEYPLLGGLILMPLMTIGFSGIFAWLALKGRNIWTAILAHSAINNLLSDAFISRIESDRILGVYLLLTLIWFTAGIVALIALNQDVRLGKIHASYQIDN